MATKLAVAARVDLAAEKVDLEVQEVAVALEVQVVAAADLAVVVREATDLVVLTLSHRN